MNPIYIQQMVEAGQRDIERLAARQQMFAGMPKKPSLVARSRQVIGASFIGAGEFIHGRPKAEKPLDSSHSAPEPAR